MDDVIAANLRAERSRRRWRQSDLAERLNWADARVMKSELGRHKLWPSELAAICRVLGVTLLDLCRGADDDDLRALGLIGPTHGGHGAPRT